MTSLINVKRDKYTIDDNFLYIGRANKWLGFEESIWHNPFPMKNEGQRKEVLRNYLEYIVKSPLMVDLYQLDNKVLGCYCSPRDCHGNILLKLRELQKTGKLAIWADILEWINR